MAGVSPGLSKLPRRKSFKTYTVLVGILLAVQSQAQILNSDRLLQFDSAGSKKINYTFGLSGSIDKQNRNLLNAIANNYLSCMVHASKQLIILLANMDLVTNGSEIIQNSGYIHLRFRDNDRLKLAPEYFSQFQWNGVLGMQSRYLLGSNLRWLAIHDERTKFSAGMGMFAEIESGIILE